MRVGTDLMNNHTSNLEVLKTVPVQLLGPVCQTFDITVARYY